MRAILLVALAASCPAQPEPRRDPVPAPDVQPPLEAGFDPPTGSACAQACSVLQWLGCPEGNATPKGESCESVCEGAQRLGLLDPLGVASCRTIACARAHQVRCKESP